MVPAVPPPPGFSFLPFRPLPTTMGDVLSSVACCVLLTFWIGRLLHATAPREGDTGMPGSTMRKVLAAVIAVALLGGVAGCAAATTPKTDAAAPAAAKSISIGFAAPLTGDNAVYGISMKRAVDLAIKEANASAEAKAAGVTFVVEPEDDQGDPKQAVNVAQLLAGKPAVVGVVGHFNSGCSIPASKVYQGAGMAMVSVSTNPQLTAQGYDVVNRIVAKDDEQGSFAAKMVAGTLKYKKVAVVDDATAYGKGLADEFVREFTAGGGTVVDREQIQAKEVDFSSILTKIKAVAPEAVYYGGAHTEGALISRQSKAMGLKVPVIGGDMLQSDEYIKLATPAAAEGDICTALGLPLEQQPKGADFKAAYTAAYPGETPGPYDSYSYDSTWVFVKAALKAGADRAGVAKAIRSMQFDGVTGSFTFDSKGDTSNKAISAYKVTKGKWEQIKL
jgi:branched-chain amino acid transport system substrate-binding protein